MGREIIDLVFKYLLLAISMVITSFVIPWIKANVDSAKYNDFLNAVELFVESANQIYTVEQWKEKKKYVLNLVIEYADKHGVTISLNEIDAIIEGFVIAVKGK